MNGNVELLNYIYQNSQMGLDTIKQILEIANDEGFKKQLQSQVNEYRSINDLAKGLLQQNGCEEKGISKLAEISTYMSISMHTLTDKTPSHISEMLIQGSTMGITDATKNIKKYKDANKDILDLADKLLKFEQNNIEQLKKFL
jgi:hypothetical protein